MPTATQLNNSSNPSLPSSLTPTPINNSNNIRSLPLDGPSNRVDLINSEHGKILCIADVRGRISQINQLATEFNAVAVIHSGDFGFYEPSSLDRISDRTLRHLIQYSSLISPQFKSQLLAPSMNVHSIRQMILSPNRPSEPNNPTTPNSTPNFALSEFPDLLTGKLKLNVPVYTVWGACEDVAILEKIRAAGPSLLRVPPQPNSTSPESAKSSSLSIYSIPNLTVLDEATTRCLVIGGVRLRLFGLGGAVVPHKLFDNGEGGATIAGGQGTMWTSVLQVGEVVDTAQRVYDPTETRLLVSHASPGREGLLAQLALVLKADLTISAGLHFRYGVSYNEFSVQHDQEAFRAKLHHARSTFNEIWDTVRSQVDAVIDDHQRQLLSNALAVANRVPAPPASGTGTTTEEPAWKNSWNWNLPDAAYGSLILDIKEGRIGAEMRSQGFNFAYRSQSQPRPPSSATPQSNPRGLPAHSPAASTGPAVVSNAQTVAGPPHQTPSLASTQTPPGAKPSQPVSVADNHKNLPPSQPPPSTETSAGPLASANFSSGRPQQQHGSGYGAQAAGGPRFSGHYPGNQHRYSRSRDAKRDDSPRTNSPQSAAAPAAAEAKPASSGQANNQAAEDSTSKEPRKPTAAPANHAPQKSLTSVPPSSANKASESGERPGSGTQSASSPAPSRKSSFAAKKKKGSGGGGAAGGAKSDVERGQEKSDVEAGAGATTRNGTSVGSTKELKEKLDGPGGESTETQGAEKNVKGAANEPPYSGPANGGGHNYKGRGGGRGGRGAPGSYNMRNNRGGRGAGRPFEGGREGFGARPAGPGLVGQALAGAGIGNKSSSNNTNHVSGATTTGNGTAVENKPQ